MLKSQYSETMIEAGCDEAGRGCLAGPVFAAAVILPKNFSHEGLTDSKLLSPRQRTDLRKIIETAAIGWAVSKVDEKTIDEINILNASILAMHQAIDLLKVKPQLLLIDGNRFRTYHDLPHHTIVHGDATYCSIAAASILAKTYRDDFMVKIHDEFPHYDWKQNKGYPCKKHRSAITQYGLSPYHRRSFKHAEQIKLQFDPVR